jgi:hypothetical protein
VDIAVFASVLISHLPLIATAAILAPMGWRRLRLHHRKAGLWLVWGMVLIGSRSILAAFSTSYTASAGRLIREEGGSLLQLNPFLTMSTLVQQALVVASVICLWRGAVACREDRHLEEVQPNISLQADRER